MRSAIILAGGKGSRLNQNKALTHLNNEPIYKYSLRVALEVTDEVVLVVKDKKEFDTEKVRLVLDLVAESSPLIGMYSGLQHVRGEYTLVLPCDTPFLKAILLKRLFEEAEGFDAAIPLWSNGNIEPLVAVYKTENIMRASHIALSKGFMSPRDAIAILSKVNYVEVERLREFDPRLMSFFNVNTPADLKLAERVMKESG